MAGRNLTEKPTARMSALSDRDGSGGSATAVFVSGALAGVVSRTATAPLDRLKTMQMAGCSSSHAAASCTRGALAVIFRSSGITGLFQGNTANIMKAMPEVGVKFLAFEQFACSDPKRKSLMDLLASGAAAGFASTLIIYPLEVAKTRMALAPHGYYSSVFECLRTTIRCEGVGALSQGLGASLVGIVPFCALDLALYATLKDHVQQRTGGEPSSIVLLGCGACSSAVAQVATYPLALIRTIMQAAGMPGFENTRYASMLDCAARTVELRGIRGLYRGLLPSMMRGVPSLSLSYVVFEQTKRWLGAHSSSTATMRPC